MMAGDSIRFAAIVNRELEALRDYLTQRYRIALETGV